MIASSYSKSFVTSDLPTHSLCKYLGIRTPEYKITHWAKVGEKLFWWNGHAAGHGLQHVRPFRQVVNERGLKQPDIRLAAKSQRTDVLAGRVRTRGRCRR